MAEIDNNFDELTEQSAAFRDAAIADMETVAAAAETLGGTLTSALAIDPTAFTAAFVAGMNEVLSSAQLLNETLQTGLTLDTSSLGEDGLLGILSQITESTDGVSGFFQEMALQAQIACEWLDYTTESLGALYDLSQLKGLEQTDGLLLTLETRQVALDENRIAETGDEQLALDDRLGALQDFLETSFDLQSIGLGDEEALLSGFQQSGLTSLFNFEGNSLALKAASITEGLGLTFEGQKAEGEVTANGLNEKLSLVSQAFGSLGNLMYSENLALFRIGQTAAIAEVGVNTALGAIKAFQSMADIKLVGTALGAAAAASVAAAGAASMNEIRSQKPGSGKPASAGFKPVKASEGAAPPKISAGALPNVAGGGAGVPGAANEVQVHLADKPLLNAIMQAANDGRLVISSRAIQ